MMESMFPSRTNQKLHARGVGAFKVLQRASLNAYVLDLPLDFGMNSTFDVEDLIA